MAIWQGESRRKATGGRRKFAQKKRKYEIGRERHLASVGGIKRKQVRIRGGHARVRVLESDVAAVTDPKTGKTRTAKITNVVENPANPHYVRRNVLTKGATIDTEAGRARITSRPGQDGTINAVLLA